MAFGVLITAVVKRYTPLGQLRVSLRRRDMFGGRAAGHHDG